MNIEGIQKRNNRIFYWAVIILLLFYILFTLNSCANILGTSISIFPDPPEKVCFNNEKHLISMGIRMYLEGYTLSESGEYIAGPARSHLPSKNDTDNYNFFISLMPFGKMPVCKNGKFEYSYIITDLGNGSYKIACARNNIKHKPFIFTMGSH